MAGELCAYLCFFCCKPFGRLEFHQCPGQEHRYSGEYEHVFQAEVRADGCAEQGPDGAAYLLGGEHQPEDAAALLAGRIADEYGVHGRIDAGVEQASGKLQRGKRNERCGHCLGEHHHARAEERYAHGVQKAAALAVLAPEGRGDGAGKAAEREDDAGDHDDVVHGVSELSHVHGQDGLEDEYHHLDHHGAEQDAAHDGIFEQVDFFGLLGALDFFGRLGLAQRLFDEQGQHDGHRGKRCGGQKEGGAHPKGTGENAAQ